MESEDKDQSFLKFRFVNSKFQMTNSNFLTLRKSRASRHLYHASSFFGPHSTALIPNMHECNQCDRSFASVHGLNVHSGMAHTGTAPIVPVNIQPYPIPLSDNEADQFDETQPLPDDALDWHDPLMYQPPEIENTPNNPPGN